MLCLGVALALFAGCGAPDGITLDVTGQIEAVSVGVGSRVGGRAIEVPMREGDRVKQGDVLVKLDDAEATAAVHAAEAKLAQASALVAKLETGARPEEIQQAEAAASRAEEQYRAAERGLRSQEVRGAGALADAARAQRDEASTEFARIEKLRKDDVASQQQFDRAKHALEAAEAQYQAAREKQSMAKEGARVEEINAARAAFEQASAARDLVKNGARKEDVDAARGARDAAQADLDRAHVMLNEMTIVSPREAMVESLDIHPGDIVKPGAAVSLVDPEDLELIVYVGAPMLGFLKTGQKVKLTADAHGPQEFEGVIERIAAEGEFTPRNLQTVEERVQQVFGVKLKLNSAGGKLRGGMTVTAHFPPPASAPS